MAAPIQAIPPGSGQDHKPIAPVSIGGQLQPHVRLKLEVHVGRFSWSFTAAVCHHSSRVFGGAEPGPLSKEDSRGIVIHFLQQFRQVFARATIHVQVPLVVSVGAV